MQPAWDDPIAALRAGVPHTAWTVDDLDAAHARAVEAGGRSVWAPRDTPEPGLRIAFVADPDGNLVELLSREEGAPRPEPGVSSYAAEGRGSVVAVEPGGFDAVGADAELSRGRSDLLRGRGRLLRRGADLEAQASARSHSGADSPEPPSSVGKSLSFGRPSFIGSTVDS